MIPKEYVVEYATGEHYGEYKYSLKLKTKFTFVKLGIITEY